MKHVVVTGANGNLGLAITKHFLDRGDRVSAVVSPRAGEDFFQHKQMHIFRTDLTSESEASATMDKIHDRGPVQAAVLTVGGFGMGTLEETSLSDFEKMYRLNFVTSYNSARPLFTKMKQHPEGGQIIFIGARPAMDPSAAGKMISYSLTKSLIFRLAEVINQEGEQHHVTASVVVPSIIDTPANRKAMPDSDPSGWVTPGDIANHILHLVSPAGKKLRRTILKVYGDS